MMKDVTFAMFKKVATTGQAPDEEAGIKGFPGLNVWGNHTGGMDRPDVELINGAVIHFRSADNPDSLLGTNLSGAWCDEASLYERLAYENLIGCLRENGVQGWLSATFTARGLTHWTYDVFATGRKNSALFRSHTKENLHNPPGFAEVLAGELSSHRARQELAGEFLTAPGSEWPAEWFLGDIWFDSWGDDYVCRAISLDPSMGKSRDKGDDSAFVLLQLNRDGSIFVDCDAERRPPNEICQRAVSLNAAFHPDWFGIEEATFQQLLCGQIDEECRKSRTIIPICTQSNRNVEKLLRIRRLTPYLQHREVRFKRNSPGVDKLLAQMRDFPDGEYDDCPDAFEMSVRLTHEQLGMRATDNLRTGRLTDEH